MSSFTSSSCYTRVLELASPSLPAPIGSSLQQFFLVSLASYFLLHDFPSGGQVLCEPLTERSQWERRSSSPADAVTSPFPSHNLRLLLTPPGFSPFCYCFNSTLIRSHVPHQVFISSLLLRVLHAQAHTQSQKSARARSPNCRCLCLPHWCVNVRMHI